MNKQKTGGGIEWTHLWGRPGYTSNPVQGCEHDCRWTMPDGIEAQCYAKAIAEKFRRPGFFDDPKGFEAHYWHPEELVKWSKLKEPAGIFLDSMSDLMGKQVPEEQIQLVLDACRANPQHIFFLLTKNAPRLLKFEFPENVWIGASSPPDFMHGKPLTWQKQAAMLETALKTLNSIDASVRWMSFEPLSRDVSEIVREAVKHNALQWAVIGAASDGPKHYPPDEAHLRALVDVLDGAGVPIFYKGNLDTSDWAKANWRKEYPPEPGKKMVLSVEPLPEAARIPALEDELRTLRQQYADLTAAHADLQEAAQPFVKHYGSYENITPGDVEWLRGLI